MSYPGGKEGAGVWQRIVNLMPPHETYVELFAGGGAVLRNKQAAPREFAFDVDPAALAALQTWANETGRPTRIEHVDALTWLIGHARGLDASCLIYADPPYPLSARRTDRTRYARDLTDEEHVALLEHLSTTAARVMVSGYRCPIYDAWLSEWRRVDYMAMTRGGVQVPESLWLNYDPPQQLHGYARVGDGYRERERIKRKRKRWLANFAELGDLEREAIYSDLHNFQQQRRDESGK